MSPDQPNNQPNILIVGAGPTGLTAAVELARQGIMPTIIERHDSPSNLSRAVGILPPSMEIFDRSEVGDKIGAEAVAISKVVFHNKSKVLTRFRMDHLPDPRMRIFGLAQDRTESILRESFENLGGKIRFGAELQGLEQDETQVRATISGQVETYDYVIAADGVSSVCRNALGIEFAGYDLPDQWSIADVDVPDWRGAGEFQAYILGQGNIAIVVPLEAERYRVIASLPDAIAALPVPINVTNVRRAATFTISVRQIKNYGHGRVYFAGDSAHTHSPVGGRGMNLGIADAAELAACFVNNSLEDYSAVRHAAGKTAIDISEQGRKVLMSKNWFVQRFRNVMVWTVGRVPGMNSVFVRQALRT